MQSSGTVRMIKDISADLTARDVIIVEDIIDTGLTINYLRKRMIDAGVKSISFVAVLIKLSNFSLLCELKKSSGSKFFGNRTTDVSN